MLEVATQILVVARMKNTGLLLPALRAQLSIIESVKVPEDRMQALGELIQYINEKRGRQEPVHLNFICTHNSRRSQLAQIWAQVMSAIYNVDAQCYSGGIEVTELNSRAVEAIQRQGFEVIREGINNPYYFVCYSNDRPSIQCYSKIFDDQALGPIPPFAAIMTCAHADENCPVISGAESRIPIRYEDPKLYDGIDQEREKYTERSLQIASEMMYVFSNIKGAE